MNKRTKECGTKESKFTPNLQSLIARYSHKIAHYIFVELVHLSNVLILLSTLFFSKIYRTIYCLSVFCFVFFFFVFFFVKCGFDREFFMALFLLKGRFSFFYSAISEANCKLAFFFSVYYDLLEAQLAFFCSPFFSAVINSFPLVN